MSSLRQKATSGAAWTSLQQLGTVGIRMVLQILLARIISPEDFGLFGLILIFNAIGKTLSDAGMGQSLIRSNRLTEKDYGTVFLLNLSVSVLVYLLIFIGAPWVAEMYQRPVLTDLIRIYALVIILSSFSTIQIYRLQKLLKFKQQALIQLPSLVISSCIGIYLAYQDFEVWALVWMEVALAALLALQFWIFTSWRPQILFDTRAFREHFNFGYKLLFAGLLDSIFMNIYPMVIGKFASIAQVGYFTRAFTLQSVPVMMIMSALGQVTYPVLAEVKEDRIRLKAIYRKMLQLALFVIAPLMLLLAIMAKPLIVLLITDVWLPAVPYFQLLCLAGILFPLHVYNLNMLKVLGRSDLFLKAEFYKKILGIVILFVTAPFGIMMMLYGILAASVLSLLINQYFSSLVFNYSNKEQTLDSLKIIWPALLVAGIVFFANQWVDYSPGAMNYFLHILLLNFVFIGLYTFAQYVFNPLIYREMKQILLNFKIKPKKNNV